MKKILLFITFLFVLSVSDCYAANGLSFIYINGSNNNDLKMKNWYENGVAKLHPVMRKKFLNNRHLKKFYSVFGGLDIKKEPVIFFWGYESKNDLDFVKDKLEISKMVSSSGAYIVRSLITEFLHDAIWVQKPHNMQRTLEELNKLVKKEVETTGNNVILYGYSAGSFVTYQYLFNKLRYINLEKLFVALESDEDLMDFVKSNPQNNTCLSALFMDNSGIGALTSRGHLVLNPNKNLLKENYLKLDEVTERVCAPDGKVTGIVNFASPLALFYSDMADKDYEMNYYNRLAIKYIMENEIFMLTVNFREDPLGFPSSRNLTINEIEEILDMSIDNPTGIVYDNSGVWSKRLFPFAHTAYWNARGTFSKAVVNSLVNGYKFQHNPKFQKKVLLNKNSKKFER